MTGAPPSAPNLAKGFNYAFRNTSDEAYMFDHVMQALKSHKMAIATGALAYATDDVISKTMGEKVLPALMQKNGTKVEATVTFQTQAFDLSPQVSDLVAPDRSRRGRCRSGVGRAAGAGDARARSQGTHRCGIDHCRSGTAPPDGQGGRRHHHSDHVLRRPERPHQEIRSAFIKGAKAEGVERSAAAQFDAATFDIVLS